MQLHSSEDVVVDRLVPLRSIMAFVYLGPVSGSVTFEIRKPQKEVMVVVTARATATAMLMATTGMNLMAKMREAV